MKCKNGVVLNGLLFLLLLLIGFTVKAQQVGNSVVNAAGGTFQVAGTDHAYNIGETWSTTITDGTNTVTEGFLQPEFISLGLSEDLLMSTTGINVFPNPTYGRLNIGLSSGTIHHIKVYHVDGSVLQEQVINSQETTLDLSVYARGFYFIEVFTGQSAKGARFKIIKH